jgi:hypothetical protein
LPAKRRRKLPSANQKVGSATGDAAVPRGCRRFAGPDLAISEYPGQHLQSEHGPMTDLSHLVDASAVSSLPYVDPVFPDRQLVLHAARPRAYHRGLPVLFVHHGVVRNGGDYRDYWLDLVEDAGILAISIEFPEASFPEHLWYHFGNLRDKDGIPTRREEWTYGIDERLFELLRAQRITTRQSYGLFGHSPAGSSFTECSHSVSATTSRSPSPPMPGPMRCRI